MDMKDIKNKINAFSERYIVIYYLIIIILINLVGLTLYFRLDLTRNNSYSISPISEEVVSELGLPLNIKVFFTKNLPAPYNSVYRYLKDLLEEYAEYGNKYFRYEFIDVENEKDLARDFGISSVQIREIKDDQLKFRNAYMGLAFVHGDLIEKIDSITSSEGLEYNITTLIQKITGKIDTLQQLEKPIEVILYASSNLPIGGMGDINEKITKIVDKCKSQNYDKIEYRYVDPSKESDTGNVDEIYGVVKLNWNSSIPMDGRTVKPGEGLIGLVIELEDRFETIQLISRTLFGGYVVGGLDNLEDKINEAIDKIININPKVGYITGHGEKSLSNDQNGAPNLKGLLSDMYSLEEIDLTEEEIPEGISTIIINGPKDKFSDYELLKIDQFIMKGRSVLFLVDSFNEIRPQGGSNMFGQKPVVLPLNTGLEKILIHYGVTINKDIICDVKSYKAMQKGFGGQQIYFVPLIEDAGLDDDSEITRYLKTVVVPKASSLKIADARVKDQKLEKTILISSSEKSWLMQGRINFMPFGLSPPEESKMSKYDIAALLSGKFTSYFKGKDIPVPEEKDEGKAKKLSTRVPSAAIIEKAVKPGKIIVAGTSELTSPGVIDKEGESLNSILFHNMIDSLSNFGDVPEMRSKGLEYNPLEDSSDAAKLILKLINIAGLPIIVICSGLVVWRRRRVKKAKIMKEYTGV